MKTGPSLLSPFLRSNAQGAVLAETMINPDQELSIAEIARRADVLPAVAHREVTRLIDADVLTDRREGNNRLTRPNIEHPLYSLMAQLVTETYGPVPVLRDLLADCEGVKDAFIYGSWAARRNGAPGPPPRDVDVLVVGKPSRTKLLDIADAAREKLRQEVNIHVTAPEAWSAKTDPFLATVASRPMVALIRNESTS